MAKGSPQYAIDSVRDLLKPLVPSFEGGRFHATLHCSGCTAEKVEWSAAKMPEPSVVHKKVRQKARGWNIGKRESFGPACVARLPRARPTYHAPMDIPKGVPEGSALEPVVEVVKPMRASLQEQIAEAFSSNEGGEKMAAATAEVVTISSMRAVTPPDRIDPAEARRLKREVYAALLDGYDAEKQRYNAGHSDETIAKETGASPAFVAKVREDDFGPVGTPVEVEMLLSELKAAKDAVKVAEEAVAVGMEKLTDAEKRVAAAERKIIAAAQRYGWAL